MDLTWWSGQAARQAAVIAGRCISYWVTHQTSARYLCALSYEMEMLGFPQWAALRWALDNRLGAGHCREMWEEEMGLD